MSHSEEAHHVPKNYWEKELEKVSLKEPSLVSKYFWLKPLTMFHSLEFRGLDKRDFYEPQDYDAWDYQAWNIQSIGKFDKRCSNYYVDLKKCHHYLKSEFGFIKQSFIKRTNYCWKQHDNLSNCKRV
jgi:hypothetical protein